MSGATDNIQAMGLHGATAQAALDPRQLVVNAVVLAASPGSVLYPLADVCPKLLLPLANQPLLNRLNAAMSQWGICDAAIVCRPGVQKDRLGKLQTPPAHGDVRWRTIFEDQPAGTAGAIRNAMPHIGRSHLLVVQDGVLEADIDIKDLLSFHNGHSAGMTIVVTETDADTSHTHGERIVTDHQGRVEAIQVRPIDHNTQSSLRSAGIYLLSPQVIGLIPKTGHFDLKEQLVPLLLAQGIPVFAYRSKVKAIQTLSDYMHLSRQTLSNGIAHDMAARREMRQIGDQIWADADTHVSPDAILQGPVILGRGCRIDNAATVIGPTTIGDGCVIERGAFIHQSILWDGVRVARHAKVRESVIADHSTISPQSRVSQALVLDSSIDSGASRPLGRTTPDGHAVRIHAKDGRQRAVPPGRVFRFTKRLLDIVVSGVVLLAGFPFFALVALAVKLDSPGPIFFRQYRCGQGGRPFPMIKFRTMVVDAHERQSELFARRATDGPMFKLEDDPRVTRIGRFLRRFRLDELPQLHNVLCGQMSLVGPRPLVAEEMRYVPGWRDIRLAVKPGLTGLWQVNCRDALRFSDWIRYDIQYVQRQSLWLDLVILLLTARVVVCGTRSAC